MTACSLSGAVGLSAERRSLMRLGAMSATTVVASAWMLAGNAPPISLADSWTSLTASFVRAYCCCNWVGSSFALPLTRKSTVVSRSFCRSWTRTLSRWPRMANCETRPNWAALDSADANRRPPKTRPISSASTITANSRRATGQSASIPVFDLAELTPVDLGGRLSTVPACALALAVPWFPIARDLADTRFARNRPTTDGEPGATRGLHDQPPRQHHGVLSLLYWDGGGIIRQMASSAKTVVMSFSLRHQGRARRSLGARAPRGRCRTAGRCRSPSPRRDVRT